MSKTEKTKGKPTRKRTGPELTARSGKNAGKRATPSGADNQSDQDDSGSADDRALAGRDGIDDDWNDVRDGHQPAMQQPRGDGEGHKPKVREGR